MTRGVLTPDEVEVEFRKHYLVTGSIRASARQAKIPVSTAQELASRANEDEDFVRARTAMYARALPDAERMLREGMEVALDRLEQGPVSLADLSESSAAAKVTIQDPCPAYFRGLVDAYKAITANRKAGETVSLEAPGEVTIRIVAAKAPESGDGASEAA